MDKSTTLDPRREKILQYIRMKGFASPDDLAKTHGVAAITVRRDLIWLENAGFLKRVHGGAIPREGPLAETHIAGRMQTATDAKRQIATTAIGLLRSGNRIFLDAGSTCCFMAEALPENLDLTVVTHSLDVIQVLALKRGFKVVSIGGELDMRLNTFVGPMAEAALETFHVDQAFLGTTGLDLVAGCSINSLTEERLKSLMAAHARECYVLADSSKFGTIGLRTFLPLSRVSAVISDNSLAESLRSEYRQAGVTLRLAEV